MRRLVPDLNQQRPDENHCANAQGDLFAAGGWPEAAVEAVAISVSLSPKDLDDAALLAAVPYAKLGDCEMLSAELVERRLAAAAPALEALCRRFRGFGRTHPVREQIIALNTLAALGGAASSAAVTRLVAEGIIERPGLRTAFTAAAVLKARLPADIVLAALGDAEPAMRALACQCARFWPQAAPRLLELLHDLHEDVANAAAVTLGGMGRREAMSRLMRLIETAPSAKALDALVTIADDNCFVLLGRIAQTNPELRPMLCEALTDVDHPVVIAVLRHLKKI